MYKTYAALFAFIFLPLVFSLGCGGSNSSSTPPSTPPTAETVGITATSGTSQSAAGGKPFAAPLAATVTTNGVATGGETVTFTAPSSGASGTFANGTTTETDPTGDNGVAKSSTFTANSVSGPYAVTATVTGVSTPVSFSLTNIATTPYVFFLSGEESSGSFYALAGAIILDSSGNVLGGEQDYNDGEESFVSPEPSGDKISAGSLTFPSGYPPGQGILTLCTSNMSLGVNETCPNSASTNTYGVETFGVQFVNANHALIMQFDGFATSSGSMDFQTLGTPAAAGNGGYAFAMSGTDSSIAPFGFGGVFTLSGTAISDGVLDTNDSISTGQTVTGTAFTATVSTPDTYGRGAMKGIAVSGSKVSLNYYMVGAEVLRLIDVDTTDTAIGSAFGQGFTNSVTNTFSPASLVPSVFTMAGNYANANYAPSPFAAVGQFITSPSASPASFTGVGDDSEPDDYDNATGNVVFKTAEAFSGTYSVGANGYGNFNFKTNNSSGEGLGDLTMLGIYLTDPNLNLNDPNNSAGGGGALVVDLDSGQTGIAPTGYALAGGTGVIVPQTDISTADFNGNYAAGWQNYNYNFCGCEFDLIAQAAMTANGSLSLTGLVSDPFNTVQPDQTSIGNTLAGTPLADPNNPGRYSMIKKANSITSVIDGIGITPNFQAIIYQASAGQLFWLGWDQYDDSVNVDDAPVYVSLGPIEQQTMVGLPSAKNPAVHGKTKRK